MNNCLLLLLGATGDLATKKIIPALYALMKKGALDNFALVGAAYDTITPRELLNRAQAYIADYDEVVFEQLVACTYYERVDFSQQQDFTLLKPVIERAEQKHTLSGNRIVYCSTAAHFFCPITQTLAQLGLARRLEHNRPWHRLVYEKPFGYDLQSAERINACIAEYFDEQQIYRIDHFLTKEIVGNIALVRFTNSIFEPLWNNRYIDHVQIILDEQISSQHRTAYYDAYGALKDIVQNHILELLALVGMEAPEKLTGEHIRAQRAKVLEKVTVVDAVLGQYEGYQQEKLIKPHSTTETFAAVAFMINNPRWSGVPFYIKTGKCLAKKETAIHIKFKQVDCLLTKNCPSDSNYLTIQIFPDSSLFLSINAKKPGLSNEVMPIKMEFSHDRFFSGQVPEAYEILLQEIMRGENAVSVRFDEIESAWKVIDTLKALQLPVYRYKQGSSGPVEVNDFCKKHGFRWRS